MAYAAWSVVFGEQPSAAKWNILGTNDSTFNTLLGTYGVRNPYCFRAYASGGTTLTDGVAVKIALATENYDYNSNFAASTYTAPLAGVYHFDGRFQISGAIASPVLTVAYVYVNGAAVAEGTAVVPTANNTAVNVSTDVLLAVNDTVDFYGYQDSGGNEVTVTGSASTYFSGHLLHAV